jgi:hypothetical protein
MPTLDTYPAQRKVSIYLPLSQDSAYAVMARFSGT